jgi:hypothetical protein
MPVVLNLFQWEGNRKNKASHFSTTCSRTGSPQTKPLKITTVLEEPGKNLRSSHYYI